MSIKKLRSEKRVYNNTQKEKRFIEDDIYLRQLEINKFNRELKVLRKEYADILVKHIKTKVFKTKLLSFFLQRFRRSIEKSSIHQAVWRISR